MNDRIAAWMTLLDSGVSHAVISRLTTAFGGPQEALAARDFDWAERVNLRPEQIRRLRDSQNDAARLRRQIEEFERHEMHVLELGTDGYPAGVARLTHPPPVLFVRGELVPEDELAIALVGPRMATPYGLEVARRLATQLAPVMTVISGLAVGIDSAVHAATMDAGGRTIGVAACGLDQDYPKGNKDLRERIITERAGAIVTAYPPLTKTATHQFAPRNYVVAGLSLGVVVVEASEKSGALVTARAAADEGREVFAVPGDITRRNSRGTNALIRDGAALITTADEILVELEPVLTAELSRLRRDREEEVPGAEPPPTNLSPAEELVLEFIRHTNRQYDEIVGEFVPDQLSLGELTGALLTLELKSLIKQLPGKVFMPR
ncbi:DNA-processing protein DprA [bacterium]|nr:DNA-processing protein DprA [bacterium]